MTYIDYFFSVTSPFTYLAGLKLEAIAARHGLAIAYHPADFSKVFAATGGAPAPERHPSRQAYRRVELRRSAAKAGLPITLDPAFWPADGARAGAALIAADAAGFAIGAAAHGVLRAVWAEDRDIADPATLSAILAAHGIAERVIEPHLATAASAYDANAERATAAGAFGAPFYIVEGEPFWGHDRLADLEAHVASRA